MCKVIYRSIKNNELAKASKQITNSYRMAYKGLMNDECLMTLTDDYWIDILLNSLSRGDTCLVAKDNYEIIGTAVFGKADDGVSSKNAILHAIYLTPQYIGCGIGHRLYTEVEKTMKIKYYKSCILEVLSSNNRAIDFYLKHGFTKTGDFSVEENGMILQCDTMKKCIV